MGHPHRGAAAGGDRAVHARQARARVPRRGRRGRSPWEVADDEQHRTDGEPARAVRRRRRWSGDGVPARRRQRLVVDLSPSSRGRHRDRPCARGRVTRPARIRVAAGTRRSGSRTASSGIPRTSAATTARASTASRSRIAARSRRAMSRPSATSCSSFTSRPRRSSRVPRMPSRDGVGGSPRSWSARSRSSVRSRSASSSERTRTAIAAFGGELRLMDVVGTTDERPGAGALSRDRSRTGARVMDRALARVPGARAGLALCPDGRLRRGDDPARRAVGGSARGGADRWPTRPRPRPGSARLAAMCCSPIRR